MKILLKYPTRSRPHLWADTIRTMTDLASGKHELCWLCSIDADDAAMNNEKVHAQAASFGVTLHVGSSKTKIEAINRDMDKAGEWDVLLNAADDMRPTLKGWDQRIADDLTTLDSGLWYFDGNRRDLCTLSIFGSPVLDRMQGNIYHPAFESVYADNYYHLVMERWGRLKLVLADMFKHEWRKQNNDELMRRNEDKVTYAKDKAAFLRLRDQFNQTGQFL